MKKNVCVVFTQKTKPLRLQDFIIKVRRKNRLEESSGN